jgi:glycosyltransferase involved in cell wall biosynthesis
MPDILLSLLIPGVPKHLSATVRLLNVLQAQDDPRLEVIMHYDNMRVPLGKKRNAMAAQARGKFVAHIDDDDLVTDDFVSRLLPECEADVDLIAYDATCSLNGAPEFRVITQLGAQNQQPNHLPGGRYTDIVRTPWTWCLWRRDIAQLCKHPDRSNTEDADWLAQALPLVKTHRKIDWIGYRHFYSVTGSSFA